MNKNTKHICHNKKYELWGKPNDGPIFGNLDLYICPNFKEKKNHC